MKTVGRVVIAVVIAMIIIAVLAPLGAFSGWQAYLLFAVLAVAMFVIIGRLRKVRQPTT